MTPWHYARIKINAAYPWPEKNQTPFQASAGNWVFFWIHWRHNAKKSIFRNSYQSMTTIGLDGVE